MTVRIIEIHAAATIVQIGFTGALLARIGPIAKPSVSNTRENLIEFAFTDQKCVMLQRNRAFAFEEIERNVIVELNYQHLPELDRAWQSQNIH